MVSELRPRPTIRSALLLMALNDAVCTLLVFPKLEFLWVGGPDGLGVYFAEVFLLGVLVLSTLLHVVCLVAEATSFVTVSHIVVRSAVYCFPAILLVYSLVTSSPSPQAPNKMNPSTSPSGRYVLHVSTGGSKSNWCIDIQDAQHQYDFGTDTENSGYHGGYWIWDEHDCVWFHSGDTGRTSYWQVESGAWKRHEFDWQTAPKDSPLPPRNLIKERWQIDHDKFRQEWELRQQAKSRPASGQDKGS